MPRFGKVRFQAGKATELASLAAELVGDIHCQI
jgi:hypothetical protein